MRLIAGILQLDGSLAIEESLARMAAAMTPSGLQPTSASKIEGPLGLLVLDFSGTPASIVEQDRWIVAADLRLDRPGARSPEADLLAALEQHGADFPDRLDGDFGVALWDREQQMLWLGRDYIGARPLAWTWTAGLHFAFASLPKGLHAAGLASLAPDPVALATKACQTYFSRADSGFADIRYLEAGHSLRLSAADKGPPQPHRAYRPDPSHVGRWHGTPDQAAATLRTLIEEAVAARMTEAGPVACHLTGGLDSSAITVLAAREARRRGGGILALSRATTDAIGPAGLDERPLIADVLRQEPDIDHRYVVDDVAMPGDESDLDWPCSTIGGSDDRIMEVAAAFGADRLLSGVGGDEGATYNGATPYLALLRSGRWASLLHELGRRAKRAEASQLRMIYRQLISPMLRNGLSRKRGGMFNPKSGVMRYLAPAIVERVTANRLRPVLASNRAEDRVRAFADHHIPSRCTYYSILAARHGVAVSFPMLDRRIVDFILSLPLERLLADGYARQPFRDAMRGILPERLRTTEAKVGLFDQRFMIYAERRQELLGEADTLKALALPILSDIFDMDALRAGLESIPTLEDLASLQAKGQRIVGRSPWATGFTVEALILAREVADRMTGDPRRNDV